MAELNVDLRLSRSQPRVARVQESLIVAPRPEPLHSWAVLGSLARLLVSGAPWPPSVVDPVSHARTPAWVEMAHGHGPVRPELFFFATRACLRRRERF